MLTEDQLQQSKERVRSGMAPKGLLLNIEAFHFTIEKFNAEKISAYEHLLAK